MPSANNVRNTKNMKYDKLVLKPKERRIKTMLREKGLSGAIVSSPENFYYVTGFAGHQHTTSRQPGFALAVMAADDEVPTQITTMDFEASTFVKKIKEQKETLGKDAGNFLLHGYDTWVGLKTWEEIIRGNETPRRLNTEDSFDLLKKMVSKMNLANKTIGVELDYLNVAYFRMLQEAFPEAKFVNISDLFVWARSVKMEDEIQMFRSLCHIADEGFYQVSRIVEPGISERDLADCFRQSVIASGFCAPSSWSMFSTGPSGARLTLPESNVIQSSHVVKFDAGVNAEFDFYTTDTSRAWVMKDADPELFRLKDRLCEGQRRMIAAARPGLPISELFHIAYDYVKEQYPNYERGHCGHSISMGPATAEDPYIAAYTDRLLEPGMILAMEVPCYIQDTAGFNIEDMVLITENGNEVLTPKTPHYL